LARSALGHALSFGLGMGTESEIPLVKMLDRTAHIE
jgi:hypothetical protein